MILLVDIGNSRTKYLIAEKVSSQKYEVVKNCELDVLWLNSHWQEATKIILTNVSKNAHSDIIYQWTINNGVKLQIVESEAERFGVKSAYQQPKQLGIDRWLVMIGAESLYKNQNILIVDAGTATTIDVLSAQGQHFGGWILPGIDLMINGLLANTSRVKAEKLTVGSLSFGKNTSDNVNNACWAATVGAIELAITQTIMELSSLDLILLTGGNAQYLKPMIKHASLIEHNLIFYGLQRYNDH